MTVYELIEELKKFPPLDEVKIRFGEVLFPVDGAYHNSVDWQHYVIID